MTRRRVTKKAPPVAPTKSPLRIERVIVVGLAVAFFVLPLFILPNATEYGYTKTILALVLISILGILWGIDGWRKGTWTLRVPWIAWPFLALVAASLFSLLGATNGRFVVQSLVLLVYFFFLLLLVMNTVREKRDVTLLLGSFLASASLVTLYGLLQYAGVMRGPSEGKGLEQVISTLGNKEYVAGLLAYILLPATILIFRVRSVALRVIAVVLVAFNFGSLLLFDQAGANVALVAATIVLVVGCLIFRPVEPSAACAPLDSRAPPRPGLRLPRRSPVRPAQLGGRAVGGRDVVDRESLAAELGRGADVGLVGRAGNVEVEPLGRYRTWQLQARLPPVQGAVPRDAARSRLRLLHRTRCASPQRLCPGPCGAGPPRGPRPRRVPHCPRRLPSPPSHPESERGRPARSPSLRCRPGRRRGPCTRQFSRASTHVGSRGDSRVRRRALSGVRRARVEDVLDPRLGTSCRRPHIRPCRHGGLGGRRSRSRVERPHARRNARAPARPDRAGEGDARTEYPPRFCAPPGLLLPRHGTSVARRHPGSLSEHRTLSDEIRRREHVHPLRRTRRPSGPS